VILYGLIGYPLTHSLSAEFFNHKFQKEGIPNRKYLLFPLESPDDFPDIVRNNPNLRGLNVTIPYKETIIKYLDELDGAAGKIGAVNTILLARKDGRISMKGFNTDADGFRLSMDFTGIRKALVLGTGGASRAVAYSLRETGIDFQHVSRKPCGWQTIGYDEITKEITDACNLIINTTPMGMYPEIDSCPPIPYHWLNASHYLYDLIYNPVMTCFLKKGVERGTRIQNGLKMLHLQAEAAWRIWEGLEVRE
jgi:shikimate dehydrogenase